MDTWNPLSSNRVASSDSSKKMRSTFTLRTRRGAKRNPSSIVGTSCSWENLLHLANFETKEKHVARDITCY